MGYGYPSWESLCEDAVCRTSKLYKKRPNQTQYSEQIGQLEKLSKVLKKSNERKKRGEVVDSGIYTTSLEYCSQLLGNDFERMFQSLITQSPKSKKQKSISRLVNDLGVRRIVTLNYDTLLEEEIVRNEGFTLPEGEKNNAIQIFRNDQGEVARSMTLSKGGFAELIELASGNRKYRHDILHIHGKKDVSGSLVISEQDYKKRYLDPSVKQSGYLDGLDYLFSSNPIMFVGVGLSEEDLIRPLRQYLFDHEARRNRPIFALMHRGKDKQSFNFQVLSRYLKYGIFTIPYGSKRDKEPDLARELKSIRTQQSEWWDSWKAEVAGKDVELTWSQRSAMLPTYNKKTKK